MNSTKKEINYYEDFKVDQIYEHWPCKTITESDNNIFCLLTMNHHPVHSDIVYAKNAKHGKILVVGTYVLSLVVGMTVNDISIGAVANLGYKNINHLNPTYIGDTLRAESLIVAKKIKNNAIVGVVSVKTKAFNQDDIIVLELERDILIPINKKI